MKEKIPCQEKILYLLLNEPSLINKLQLEGIEPDFFDSKFKSLLFGIYNAHQRSVRLTSVGYTDFVQKSINSGEYAKWNNIKKIDSPKQVILKESGIFVNVSQMQRASVDDIDVYISSVREIHTREKVNELLDEFQNGAKKNYMQAISGFSEGIEKLRLEGSSNSSTWSFLDEEGKSFMDKLREERENPKERLSTGITDLDESMAVGLPSGSLTLFVADVGGYKTTLMLQIALNVYLRSQKDVLFVSLEMPKEMLENKIMASETGISNNHINKPELLTDKEMDRLDGEWDKFTGQSMRFCIEDTQERLTVSAIKAKIEQEAGYFKPRLVVIDYISILAPEKSYEKQAPHAWVGHMCKDLRQLGRKHGFAIISAAQLGRDAIKRLRSQKDGKQTVGSEDLRGSHDFSADADNIYALVPNPTQQQNQLQMFCIKARYGKKEFNGSTRAMLDVNADIGRINGATDAAWGDDNSDPVVKKAEETTVNYDLNLDLDAEDNEDYSSVKTDKIKTGPKGRVVFDDFDDL